MGPSVSMGKGGGGSRDGCWGTAVVKAGPVGSGRGMLGRNAGVSTFRRAAAGTLVMDVLVTGAAPVGNTAGAAPWPACGGNCGPWTVFGSMSGGSLDLAAIGSPLEAEE